MFFLALLRNNTPEDFLRVACFTAFVLAKNKGLVAAANAKPETWCVSLAHSYVATGDLDSLVTILAHATSQTNRMDRISDAVLAAQDQKLFSCLTTIQSLTQGKGGEDILTPVLKRLSELKIGVPSSVTHQLSSTGIPDDLLDELVNHYQAGSTHWTDERIQELAEDSCNRMRARRPALLPFPSANRAARQQDSTHFGRVTAICDMAKSGDTTSALRQVHCETIVCNVNSLKNRNNSFPFHDLGISSQILDLNTQ